MLRRGAAAALLVLLIAGPRTGGCGTSMLLRAQARACMRPHSPAAESASRALPGVRCLRGGIGEEEEEEALSSESSDSTEEGSEVEATGDDPVGHVPDNAPASCPGTQAAEAGKADGCAGCPNQAACASGQGAALDPDADAIHERMAGIDYKVLVLSGKGGVGKSTLASQLAMLLSKGGGAGGRGATGLLDIDICGPSAPRMMGVEASEVRQAASGWQPVWVRDNLCVMSIGFMLPSREDAVVWRGVRKNGLMKQFLKDVEWGDLDFLVVDAPPGKRPPSLPVNPIFIRRPRS
jgi:Mrp family chromosome partitioning ATPase